MKNRKVVYTALTGGYDGLLQPSCIDPSYDYICFSNDFDQKNIGIWKIEKIPFETMDIQRLSRFPKLQPNRFLKEYDFSIYIDANIDIATNYVYERAEQLYEKGIKLAGIKHQLRKCLYRESLEVILRGVEKNRKKVILQMKEYIKIGFPFNFGMYEANVIYRMHNDTQVIEQCNIWWHWQQNYSRRDQLSYSFSLWKAKVPFSYLLLENEWTKNSKDLVFHRHPQKSGFWKKLIIHIWEQFILPFLVPILFPLYKIYLKH
ncbi:glycosyltransferase domain-containing protein [Bacteroides ovatus]|uniref:glycosyltransferase domain-containing protein n=1 Tax=Bacteroides ovatus TaxID=28116 RepID=UPI0020A6EC41|nr:glycosyltransferase domain-containing protein [Bacteroides ovatus]CAG9903000.1 hypothetical protein BOVA713_4583 [Bacteroides ovatus]